MTAPDSAAEAQRLTLSEIRRLDVKLDLAAARAPLRLYPGVRSPTGTAVAGLNGHMFIGDGANHWEAQHLGRTDIRPDWFAAWRDLFARRQVEAARRGVELWNLVIPEKQVVLPEQRWSAPIPDGERRPLTRLLPELGPEARLHYAAPALIAAKPYAPPYLRRDSHWTPSGCCAAMLDLAAAIGVAVDLQTLRFAWRRTRAVQDLAGHFFEQPGEEEAGALAPSGVFDFEERTLPITGRHTGTRLGLSNPDAPDPRRVMVFGDSFTAVAGLAEALSAVFREVRVYWVKNVVWAEVEACRADLVIWQSAERFLATLAQD